MQQSKLQDIIFQSVLMVRYMYTNIKILEHTFFTHENISQVLLYILGGLHVIQEK